MLEHEHERQRQQKWHSKAHSIVQRARHALQNALNALTHADNPIPHRRDVPVEGLNDGVLCMDLPVHGLRLPVDSADGGFDEIQCLILPRKACVLFL